MVRDSSAGRRVLAATIASLNGWALDVAVGTIHAAIAFEWSQQCPTAFAVIVKLTRVGWHHFLGPVAAFWAGQSRVRLNFVSFGQIYGGKMRTAAHGQ